MLFFLIFLHLQFYSFLLLLIFVCTIKTLPKAYKHQQETWIHYIQYVQWLFGRSKIFLSETPPVLSTVYILPFHYSLIKMCANIFHMRLNNVILFHLSQFLMYLFGHFHSFLIPLAILPLLKVLTTLLRFPNLLDF